MGEQLYTVVYKKRIDTVTKSGKPGRAKWERGYRAPRPEDDVFADLQAKLEEKLPYWEAKDIVPTEAFPEDSNDDRPIQYGMFIAPGGTMPSTWTPMKRAFKSCGLTKNHQP